MRLKPRALREWMRISLGLVGTAFLLFALISRWDVVRNSVVFEWWRFLAALLFVTISVVVQAQGWACLLTGEAEPSRLRRIFYLSQPAKYIPGGIVQPIGQVALTTSEGITTGRSATAFLVHALASAGAGASIGVGALFLPGVAGWLRIVAVAGLLGPLLIVRPLLVQIAKFVAKLTRVRLVEDVIPPQRYITRTFALAVVGILCSAVAFAILAGASSERPLWGVAASFSLAFTVGFLAVPFPAGVGIREGLLSVALPGIGLGPVVAISGLHRLVSMVGELLVLAFTTPKWRRRQTPEHDGP